MFLKITSINSPFSLIVHCLTHTALSKKKKLIFEILRWHSGSSRRGSVRGKSCISKGSFFHFFSFLIIIFFVSNRGFVGQRGVWNFLWPLNYKILVSQILDQRGELQRLRADTFEIVGKFMKILIAHPFRSHRLLPHHKIIDCIWSCTSLTFVFFLVARATIAS